MAHNYEGFTTGQRGNEADETGVKLISFSCRYFPQWKDKVNNYAGQVFGWAIPSQLTRVVNFVAYWASGGAGILGNDFVTAYAFANDVADFKAVSATDNTGGFYFDEMTVSQTQDGWRQVSGTATSDPLVS